MDILRKITQWVSNHRIVSIVIVAVLAISIALIKDLNDRTQGLLSPPLQKGNIVDAVYGIGTVTGRSVAEEHGQLIATIGDLYVKEGDSVHRGDRLARIDTLTYKSPFDGVVNYLPFKVGENIFVQLPALVVTDLSDRYIVVSIEQQGALRVRPGQKAKLSFDTIRSQNYDGVVKSVYSYNSNFLARIDITSLPPEILPDMTADIAIIIQEVKDALIMPVSAYENGFVWVKRGHMIPMKTAVTLGVIDGTMAEIKSGEVSPGDSLMIRTKVTP